MPEAIFRLAMGRKSQPRIIEAMTARRGPSSEKSTSTSSGQPRSAT